VIGEDVDNRTTVLIDHTRKLRAEAVAARERAGAARRAADETVRTTQQIRLVSERASQQPVGIRLPSADAMIGLIVTG
jgi:hypothetical protein